MNQGLILVGKVLLIAIFTNLMLSQPIHLTACYLLYKGQIMDVTRGFFVHRMGLGRGSDGYKESGPTHLTHVDW